MRRSTPDQVLRESIYRLPYGIDVHIVLGDMLDGNTQRCPDCLLRGAEVCVVPVEEDLSWLWAGLIVCRRSIRSGGGCQWRINWDADDYVEVVNGALLSLFPSLVSHVEGVESDSEY